jgi:hypothetical protein
MMSNLREKELRKPLLFIATLKVKGYTQLSLKTDFNLWKRFKNTALMNNDKLTTILIIRVLKI